MPGGSAIRGAKSCLALAPAIMPQVKAGEAKCLLTLSSRKLDVLPGAPAHIAKLILGNYPSHAHARTQEGILFSINFIEISSRDGTPGQIIL
jgi:hypothetical protein